MEGRTITISHSEILQDFFTSSRKTRIHDVLCKILSREEVDQTELVNFAKVKHDIVGL